MNYPVSTLQELLDALSSVSENSTIIIQNDIEIEKPVTIESNYHVDIDLDGNILTTVFNSAPNDTAFTISNSEVAIYHGSIISDSENIFTVTNSSILTLGQDLSITASGGVANAIRKGAIIQSGAEIICTAMNGCAIYVEGYTNSKVNSSYCLESGKLESFVNAVEVMKKGCVAMSGGVIDGNQEAAIVKTDSTATIVEIIGGMYRGYVPEGSIDTNLYHTELDDNGFYHVLENEVDESEQEQTEASEQKATEVAQDTEVIDSTPAEIEEVEVTEVEGKQTEQTKEIKEQEITSVPRSIALKRSTTVYSIPSFKKPAGNVIGSITILEGEFTDPVTSIAYKKIQYRVPGSGIKAIGYIVASAIGGNNS